MEIDPIRVLFNQSKELIDKLNFEQLKINLIRLRDEYSENEYVDFLKKKLTEKLIDLSKDLISLTDCFSQLNELEDFYERLQTVKNAKINLSDFLNHDWLKDSYLSDSEVPNKLKLEIEINRKLREKFPTIQKEVNSTTLIPSRTYISYLVGQDVLDEMENNINSTEPTTNKITNEIPNSEVIDAVASNLNTCEIDENETSGIVEQLLRDCGVINKNEDPSEDILNILNELKIIDEDGLHNKIIKSILSKGLSAINDFKDDIIPKTFPNLEEKLKRLKLDTRNHINVRTILTELSIQDEENLFAKIEEKIASEGTSAVLEFRDHIAPKKFSTLISRLGINNSNSNFESSTKIDKVVTIQESKQNFVLNSKIDLNKFNSLEGFFEPFGNIIENICKAYNANNDNCAFAEALFGMMIYLIKRQQDLNSQNDQNFIKVLKRHIKFILPQLSLRELIYNLLLNSEEEVKIKIFQLLHSSNPVPFCDYFIMHENPAECKLKFHSEAYWVASSYNSVRFLSFGIDKACKGKTRLLNSIFYTIFEENNKGKEQSSNFFNGTMDLQIIKNFGFIDNNYCIVDTHGLPLSIKDYESHLSKLSIAFDAFIIHLSEDLLLKSHKNDPEQSKMLNYLVKFVTQLNEITKVFLLVRDCQEETSLNCTNREFNFKKYPSSSHLESLKKKSNIYLCRIPSLIETYMLDEYSRPIRELMFSLFLEKSKFNIWNRSSDNFASIFETEECKNIKEITDTILPVYEKLEQAIKHDGIKQTNLFSIYPIYFDLNRIQNELNRIIHFANNRDRVNELQIQYARLKNMLDSKALALVKNQKSSPDVFGQIYELFSELISSKNCILMINKLAMMLNSAFQRELSEKLKVKDEILNNLRKKQNELNQKKSESRINNRDDMNEALNILQTEYNSLEEELDKLNLTIDIKCISIEVLWREMVLIYNTMQKSQFPYSLNTDPLLSKSEIVKEKFNDLIFKGQPFEILDGDNFQFNKEFLQTIFYDKQLRIRVISILGPQNSGKSTLLNFMFGCDFTVSDGRCTRGIYGTLIKSQPGLDFDYFLILDTEGLQSIEKGDREYDRKLILFCFSVSNILIINTKDQITDDIKTTLEICVDSLAKIEMARVQKPTLYFVINQIADPNRKTDQDAIKKIISDFTKSNVIGKLELEDENFETLPSAFNKTIEISIDVRNNSNLLVSGEFRRFGTSKDFIQRVCHFTNTLLEQSKKIDYDEAFSNIYKWIEFSNIIFDTINTYPDLTSFRNIAEKIQEKELQKYLNNLLREKLSNNVLNQLRNETGHYTSLEKAEERINAEFTRITDELLHDFDDYIKRNSVSEIIREKKREFLQYQIGQYKESWQQSVKIEMRQKSMMKTISSGQGVISNRINQLLRSGQMFTKEKANNEFNDLFDKHLKEIENNMDKTLKQFDSFIDFVYSAYSAFERNLLGKREIIEFVNASNRDMVDCDFNCPLTRLNELSRNILNLKLAIKEFKVIDQKSFESFYDQCCLNLASALTFIHKFDDDVRNLNKKISDKYNVTLFIRGQSLYLNEISIENLKMNDLPPLPNNSMVQQNPEKILDHLKTIWEVTKKSLATILSTLRNKTNKEKLYLEEEFSHVIKQFICNVAIAKKAWFFIFDKEKFSVKIKEIADSIHIESKQELDYEFIQNLILKIEKLFENYNADLYFFGLCLSREVKSFAHKCIFKRLVEIFIKRDIENVEKEQIIWNNKKESLRTFFISQLAPDNTKDEESAKQCMQLLTESMEKTLNGSMESLIQKRAGEKEDQFSRFRMQEARDSTLTSLNREQLLNFILKPTLFLENDFNILWADFEKGVIEELKRLRVQKARLFDNLKDCLNNLNHSISKHKTQTESFRSSHIFQIEDESYDISIRRVAKEESFEINKISYLKGLCASKLVLDIICFNQFTNKFKPQSNNESSLFKNHATNDLQFRITAQASHFQSIGLTREAIERFKEIQSEMSGFKIDEELGELLNQLSHEHISIDFIDKFVQHLISLVDVKKSEFEKKEIDLRVIGLTALKEKYLSRVKGCETSCPCCGRLCDAEHFKIKTEIGSETNKHKCNRGHQFRGMNGYKVERTDKPSFKICPSMKESDNIRTKSQLYKWFEFKKLYPKWDFDSDSTNQIITDWTSKCTYIWSIIGEDLCNHFGMTYTPLAVDIDDEQEPIHFILVLDDSGSMSSKWNELKTTVENFLQVRSREGSPDDLVTIIYFSSEANIVVAGATISQDIASQLIKPSFGSATKYSAALDRIIQVIKILSTHKYGIVFMSDGEATDGYPESQIETIKRNYLERIYKFWCIGYGKDAKFDILKRMTRELGDGREDNFKNPQQSLELKTVYCEIASEETTSRNYITYIH